MIVGLEEPILIKSVGKMIAKVDSGNGGLNVIHGENLYYQGDVLTFETVDVDGNRKVVSKKVKDTIKINIGGGNIQERPVIELNIKFAGEDYKKIPFSVTDRSTNDQKVLISKDFLVNQLDALIDPSAKGIADKNIDIDYPLNESWLDGDKDAKDFSGKRMVKNSEIVKGIKGIGKLAKFPIALFKKSHNFIKKWGEISNVDTSYMYQYQDTFLGLKDILKNISPFGENQVPILNQFGVPEDVKDKLKQFDNYIKQYDKTRTSLKSAADDFVYDYGEDKDDKKKNESFSLFDNILKNIKLFEADMSSTAENTSTNPGDDTQEGVETNTNKGESTETNSNKEESAEKKPTEDKNTKLEALDAKINAYIANHKSSEVKKLYTNYIKSKELFDKEKDKEYTDINDKIKKEKIIYNYYYTSYEFIGHKEAMVTVINLNLDGLDDTSKKELANKYNEEKKETKEGWQKAENNIKILKQEKKLKYRGKFNIYFKVIKHNDRKNKKIDFFKYAQQYIYKVLNDHPQIFDDFIKNFYGNNEKDKKWEAREIIALLDKSKILFKNAIAENNERYFNSESKKDVIAIYGSLCIVFDGKETELVKITRDTRSSGEDIENDETEEEFFIRISKNYNRDNEKNILSSKNINKEIFRSSLKDKSVLDLLRLAKFEAKDFDSDDNGEIKQKLNNAFKELKSTASN